MWGIGAQQFTVANQSTSSDHSPYTDLFYVQWRFTTHTEGYCFFKTVGELNLPPQSAGGPYLELGFSSMRFGPLKGHIGPVHRFLCFRETHLGLGDQGLRFKRLSYAPLLKVVPLNVSSPYGRLFAKRCEVMYGAGG